MATNVEAISQLMAEEGVKALISKEPVIATADKGYNATFQDSTYQSGDTINIRIEDQPGMPSQTNVIDVDPIVQTEIPATVLQYNKGVSFGAVEQALRLGGMDRLRERVLRPHAENMAVQAAIICYNELSTAMNFFGAPDWKPKTAAEWGQGQAVLNDQLAMSEGLHLAMSSLSYSESYGQLAIQFNPSDASSTAYLAGKVKNIAGFNVYQTSNIPNHTNGSAVGSGTAGMALSANVTTGSTSITVSGGTANGTIKKNSLIYFRNSTVGNRLAVQPNTKKTLSTVRYFSVAADVTLSGAGAGTITVTTPIYGPENNKLENINVLPVSGDFVGIVGDASATYEQALAYKEKQFAFFGLPLPDLFALENSKAEYEGVQVKTVAYGDGTNYNNFIRYDILSAAKILQKWHIARTFTRKIS